MIVTVTGTPGTGKTAVSERLADLLDYQYVAVNEVAADLPGTETDPERHTLAVDTTALVERLQEKVPDDAVLDGHLSHHFPADVTVVLRCSPVELEQRLQAKGWGVDKVAENVEAEVLDLVLQQAVTLRDDVYEVDTTGKTPQEVAEEVKKIVQHPGDTDHAPGNVQWDMEQFYG